MIPSKSEVKQIVEWLTLLILLACPLMMLFCMRGMHGGKKGHAHHHSNGDEKQTLTAKGEVSQQQWETLQTQMAALTEENRHLRQEVESMKVSQSTPNKMRSPFKKDVS